MRTHLLALLLVLFSATAAPAADPVHFATGLKLYQEDHCEDALRAFDSSAQQSEQAPKRDFYAGTCLAELGRWGQANLKLAGYVKEHPADPKGWHWLAKADLHLKRFAAAREAIQKELSLDTDNADAYLVLGEIELELQNHDGAYHAWLKANTLNPSDAKPCYYIGRLFFEADLLNEAAGWFRQALKLSPGYFEAMTYLALCAERLDFQSTALDLYRAAIRESKREHRPYSWAFLNYGKLLRQLGRDQEALAVFEEAEKTCPEAHLLTALGQLLATGKQNARAEALLRQAIALDASLPDAHYRLALLLSKQGHAEEAAVELRKFHETSEAAEHTRSKIQAIRRDG